MHRIFTTSVASVYPHYVTKAERKGRTREEVDEVIEWLTGFDAAQLQAHLDDGTTFEEFFAALPRQALRRAREGPTDVEGAPGLSVLSR